MAYAARGCDQAPLRTTTSSGRRRTAVCTGGACSAARSSTSVSRFVGTVPAVAAFRSIRTQVRGSRFPATVHRQANVACNSALNQHVRYEDPCPCEWQDFEWYGAEPPPAEMGSERRRPPDDGSGVPSVVGLGPDSDLGYSYDSAQQTCEYVGSSVDEPRPRCVNGVYLQPSGCGGGGALRRVYRAPKRTLTLAAAKALAGWARTATAAFRATPAVSPWRAPKTGPRRSPRPVPWTVRTLPAMAPYDKGRRQASRSHTRPA